MDPDLAKDRLDMNLDGRLGDIDLSRDGLVGIALDQVAQDGFLPRRKPWCYSILRRDEETLVVLSRSFRPHALAFGIESERQECRGENRLAHHHQLKGLDQYVAGHDFDEVTVGARAKCGNQLIQSIAIGDDRNPAAGAAAFEKPDLFDGGAEIISGMNNEKQLLARLNFTCGQIIRARYRSQDTKICRA